MDRTVCSQEEYGSASVNVKVSMRIFRSPRPTVPPPRPALRPAETAARLNVTGNAIRYMICEK